MSFYNIRGNALLLEASQEKMRKNKEVGYIQRLQAMADKMEDGVLKLKQFETTGRIYSIPSYCSKFNKKSSDCHSRATDVIVYMFGLKLDILENGDYYLKEDDSYARKIEELEARLFEIFNDKASTLIA